MEHLAQQPAKISSILVAVGVIWGLSILVGMIFGLVLQQVYGDQEMTLSQVIEVNVLLYAIQLAILFVLSVFAKYLMYLPNTYPWLVGVHDLVITVGWASTVAAISFGISLTMQLTWSSMVAVVMTVPYSLLVVLTGIKRGSEAAFVMSLFGAALLAGATAYVHSMTVMYTGIGANGLLIFTMIFLFFVHSIIYLYFLRLVLKSRNS